MPTLPMLDSIKTLNSYGLEVTSGIILGLDTDTEHSADRLIEFIERSKIPVLTINLLHALPKTPLWDRLARDGRIIDDPSLELNVRFLRPYDDVVAHGGAALRTPTIRNGCSSGSGTRSKQPTSTGPIRPAAAG